MRLITLKSNTNILQILLNLLKGFKMTQTATIDLDLKHFKIAEFDSPDEPGSGAKMDPDFLKKLDRARTIAGCAFRINSGYRTQAHNLKVGGRYGSSHKNGEAADIAFKGSRDRYLILHALMKVGINRLGIGPSFIHCDIDKQKDQDVIWTYKY